MRHQPRHAHHAHAAVPRHGLPGPGPLCHCHADALSLPISPRLSGSRHTRYEWGRGREHLGSWRVWPHRGARPPTERADGTSDGRPQWNIWRAGKLGTSGMVSGVRAPHAARASMVYTERGATGTRRPMDCAATGDGRQASCASDNIVVGDEKGSSSIRPE